MNCRDFERIWNELFDAASSHAGDEGTAPAAAKREVALLEHAASCRGCGRLAAGYEALHGAILAWGPPPAPSADLTNRILVAAHSQLPSRRHRAGISHPIRWVAAAASVLVVITVGLVARFSIERAGGPEQTVGAAPTTQHIAHSGQSGSPRLNDALASATEATWDLARSASEPAARLSLPFLDAATESGIQGTNTASNAVSVPTLESFTPDSAVAVATIQQVGDRLASGVRPLSSSARQAFSFLLGPAQPKPETRANPPAARKA